MSWRAASACWEAGCIDRFYHLDPAHMALIIAVWETKTALEGVRIEKLEAET